MEVNSLIICTLAFSFVGATMGQLDVRRPLGCPPVCEIYCKYGNVLDYKGCPKCACKPAPCPRNSSAVAPERGCKGLGFGFNLQALYRQSGPNAFCSTSSPFEDENVVWQPVAPCPENSRAVVPERRCNGLSLATALQSGPGQCVLGAFCSTRTPFKTGKCCVEHAEQPHCPVDNTDTNCQERVDRCRDKRDCGLLEKCCPKGCGKRCVPAFGATYKNI